MGYEVFEHAQGCGDYGSDWLRLACRPTMAAAVRYVDRRREAHPSKALRIMTAGNSGRHVADFPARHRRAA